MRVTENLKVNDEKFFSMMMDSLKQDIEQATGKKMEPKEGLKYKKQSAQRKGAGSKITVKIMKLVMNQEYVVSFMTSIDHTVVSYHIDKLSDSELRVTYEEIYENVSNKKVASWQQKWAEKKSAKRARKMLHEVEKYINSNHE